MKKPLDLIKMRKEYKKVFYRINSREVLLQIGSIISHPSEYPLKQIKDYLEYIKQITNQKVKSLKIR